nr:MAG TPA: hypothetical protein [Caudoviricetes sp.]
MMLLQKVLMMLLHMKTLLFSYAQIYLIVLKMDYCQLLILLIAQ